MLIDGNHTGDHDAERASREGSESALWRLPRRNTRQRGRRRTMCGLFTRYRTCVCRHSRKHGPPRSLTVCTTNTLTRTLTSIDVHKHTHTHLNSLSRTLFRSLSSSLSLSVLAHHACSHTHIPRRHTTTNTSENAHTRIKHSHQRCNRVPRPFTRLPSPFKVL